MGLIHVKWVACHQSRVHPEEMTSPLGVESICE